MKRDASATALDEPIVDLNDRVIDLRELPADDHQLGSPALRAYRRIARRIALTDWLAVLTAFLLAYLARYGDSIRPLDFVLTTLIAPTLFVAVFAAWRLYGIHRFAAFEEFRRLVSAIALGMTLVMVASYWTMSSFSRKWIGLAWVFTFLLVQGERWLWHAWLRRRREEGRLVFRTLVVGSNEEAEHIAEALRSQHVGFDPVGFVIDDGRSPLVDGVPILGRIDGIRQAIRTSGADCVFVASSSVTYDQMHTISKVVRQEDVEIRVSANLPEIHSSRVTPQALAGVMSLALQPARLTGAQAAMKRSVDIVGAAFGLIVAAPVMAIVAVVVRSTSRGPVLFRQRRVTKGGQPFTVYKFRTMYADVDRRLRTRSLDTATPFFKASDDDLVTPVGRDLRRLSLDELPQLWNVLKGEMSLVGPRPLPAEQVAANPELLGPRHELRTGLTGWWQVNGRSDVCPEEAVQQDSFYIENWSPALDTWIVLKTVGMLIRPRGAF